MCLSLYEKHYIDRSLNRTGQNLVMISAGNGFYHVDRSLSRLTKDRMVDAGVACDLICVTRPPLHHAPLFKPRTLKDAQVRYEIPEWISIVFYDYQDYVEKPFGVPASSSMQFARDNVTFLGSRGIFHSFDANPELVPGATPVRKMGPTLPNVWDSYDSLVFNSVSRPTVQIAPPPMPKRIALLDAFNPTPEAAPIVDVSSPIPVDANYRALNAEILERWRQRSLSATPAPRHVTLIEASRLGVEIGRAFTFERVTTQGATVYVCIEWVDMLVESAVPKSDLSHRRKSSGALLPLGRTGSSQLNNNTLKDGMLEDARASLTALTNTQTVNATMAAALLANLRNLAKADDEATYFSPFEPSSIPSVEALNRDRWGNLYGFKIDIRRLSFDSKQSGSEFGSANWKSLCKPAILPLTTSKWCTPPELSKDYVEYVYVLYVDSEMGLENVLGELIAQRLATDYQQAVPPKQSQAKLEAAPGLMKKLKEAKKDKLDKPAQPSRQQQTHYFTSHNQFHQLVVDQLQGAIRVTRCVHKRTLNRFLVKIPYRSFLWSPNLRGFYLTDRDMEAAPDSFDWNKMDNLLAGGDDDEFSEETMQRSKRIRYALIPPCALQLTGPYRPPLLEGSSSNDSNNASGSSGSDRRESAVPCEDANEKTLQSRVEALSTFAHGVCNKTLTELRVVVGSQSQMVVPEEPAKPRRNGNTKKLTADLKSRLDQGFAIRGNKSQNVDVKLEKATTKFGSRQEWLRIQFDAFYDPERVFQLQIQWLVASGLHVDEWILKNFLRKGKVLKDLGIQICVIPANQSMRSADAFHTAIEVPMPNQLLRNIVRRYLLSHCGFVREMCQDPSRQQFMHHSGIAIVRENSLGFVWVDNHLMQMFQDPTPALHIFTKFNQMCQHVSHASEILENIISSVVG